MDANSPNLIAQLRNVRSNLSEALLHADNLEYKLLGPRPADTKENAPKPQESVASLLGDLNRLSLALLRMNQRHHEIVGDLTSDVCGAPSQPARYA